VINQLRKTAKWVVPDQLHPLFYRFTRNDEPLLYARRRLTDYDLGLLVNQTLREAEKNSAIALSMGYPAWNLLYFALLCSLPEHKPVTIVETGTNQGFSTIVLAQALRDSGAVGHVDTVDISAELVEIARNNVKHAGLEDLVTFHVGDSTDFLRDLRQKTASVDFAFIDAGHSYADVMAEFRALYPLVRFDGTVYFDNTSAGGVKKALNYIRRRYRGNIVEFGRCSWLPPGNAVWQPSKRRAYRLYEL